MKGIFCLGNSYKAVRGFPADARRMAGFQLDKLQCGLSPDDWKPMPAIGAGVREIRIREKSGQFRIIYLVNTSEYIYVLHAFQKKDTKDIATRSAVGQRAFQKHQELRMGKNKHNVEHVTPSGQSAFGDLFSPEEGAELEIRATLLRSLQEWIAESGQTQARMAEQLGVTQARISDIKHGKINSFSLDLLVRLAARAGLQPRLECVA